VNGTATIALRLWTWAAMLRVLKHVVPLAALVSFVRRRAAGGDRSSQLKSRLENYLEMRGRFPFRPPANCLERSLGAYRLLCEANADPALVVGVRRSAAGIEGHVWVTAAGRALAEREEDLATYAIVVTFDAKGRQLTTAGFESALATLRVR
jgi:hypothetical protein